MFIKNATVTVDGTAASDHVSNILFASTPTTATFLPVSGNSKSSSTPGPWTCTMTVAQDWTAGTVADLLWTREGEEVEIVFMPDGVGPGKPMFTVTVTAAPPGAGGAPGVAVSQVVLPCAAKPVRSTQV